MQTSQKWEAQQSEPYTCDEEKQTLQQWIGGENYYNKEKQILQQYIISSSYNYIKKAKLLTMTDDRHLFQNHAQYCFKVFGALKHWNSSHIVMKTFLKWR